MTLVFSSFRICSHKSFCAQRQAPSRALQGYVCVPTLGVGCITPPCVLFSKSWLIPSVSIYHTCVYSSFCLLNNQFILFPTAIKSLLINHFHILSLMCKFVLEVSKQMFTYSEWKRAGRGGRGLDLEAKARGAETLVFYFSRRSDSEGS